MVKEKLEKSLWLINDLLRNYLQGTMAVCDSFCGFTKCLGRFLFSFSCDNLEKEFHKFSVKTKHGDFIRVTGIELRNLDYLH